MSIARNAHGWQQQLAAQYRIELVTETKYMSAYREMEKPLTSQMAPIVEKFLKHWDCDEVNVALNEQRSSRREVALKQMSRTAIIVWILSSAKRALISVNRE